MCERPAFASGKRRYLRYGGHGRRQLAAARREAQKTGKRVLLDLGANWCSDSQAMYRLLKSDPAIIQEINDHFVLVMVDVNERDGPPRNQPLVESLGKPSCVASPFCLC